MMGLIYFFSQSLIEWCVTMLIDFIIYIANKLEEHITQMGTVFDFSDFKYTRDYSMENQTVKFCKHLKIVIANIYLVIFKYCQQFCLLEVNFDTEIGGSTLKI